jgi:hypothetical protein
VAGIGEAGLYHVGLIDLFNYTAVFWGRDMQRVPTQLTSDRSWCSHKTELIYIKPRIGIPFTCRVGQVRYHKQAQEQTQKACRHADIVQYEVPFIYRLVPFTRLDRCEGELGSMSV